MAGRKPLLNFLPVFLSVVIFVAILLVLLAGVNNGLVEIYYLKTDISNLKLPPTLSGSEFLRDLSAVSGTDLVGEEMTASSLGLASSYTISLITSCARFPSGPVCSRPNLRFFFNPGFELRLDATSLQTSYSSEYKDALAVYKRSSAVQAGAFVVCALLTGLAAISTLLGTRFRYVGALAAVYSVLCTIFLLVANAVGTYVFRRLNNALNADFNQHGLSSTLGVAPFALGWVAFALSLIVSVMLVVRTRRDSAAARNRVVPPRARAYIAGSDGEGVATGQKAVVAPAPGPGGLFGRVATWNKHKYVQVEKQPALGASHYPGQEQSALVEGGRQPGPDDDWAADDAYSRARYGDGGTGAVAAGSEPIAMKNLGAEGVPQNQRKADTAYEPYSSAM